MRPLIGAPVVIALLTCLAGVGSAQPGGTAPAGRMTWAVHALALTPAFPYSAPYEDVRLKP